MSVRAYKIIKVEYADHPTFNLWHDKAIMDALERADGVRVCLGEDCGEIEVSSEAIQPIKTSLTASHDTGKITDAQWDEALAILKDIKKDMGDAGYVTYSCF